MSFSQRFSLVQIIRTGTQINAFSTMKTYASKIQNNPDKIKSYLVLKISLELLFCVTSIQKSLILIYLYLYPSPYRHSHKQDRLNSSLPKRNETILLNLFPVLNFKKSNTVGKLYSFPFFDHPLPFSITFFTEVLPNIFHG